MTLHFLNTLGNQKQEFRPIRSGEVGLYTCGPTVYNYAHIGNHRAYIFEDILRRWLKYRGFRVTQVMNITDVEDKIIRDSTALGISPRELAEKYTKAFFEDLDRLQIERAEHYPRATEHIPEMVDLIKCLRDRGYAYESEGSIYFPVARFKDYGRLSGIRPEKLMAGARVDSDEYEKSDARDFVLWKAWKGENIWWDTELGKGRPGWHIECSAMSIRYLGETFDIHTGGEDNIFPHHENEMAQSECATGKPFVNYWLHNRYLLVDGQKMSKSLGNFYTLRDLLEKGLDPLDIRYTLARAHYRTPVDFSEAEVRSAKSARRRLLDFRTRLGEHSTPGRRAGGSPSSPISRYRESFEAGMDDDLNSAAALGAVFEMVSEVNRRLDKGETPPAVIGEALRLLEDADRIFSFVGEEETTMEPEIEDLIREREEARSRRDFAAADAIRKRLQDMGIILEDTPSGTRWKRA